ncbi:MAG: long-chain fatty acid--CoA ligase [Bacteroidetes bacterium QS_8_68_15]|nr:MAG: long-chain fatty acid--CoA ligase [Bacteroidetes bacterium QS_8_68_15]
MQVKQSGESQVHTAPAGVEGEDIRGQTLLDLLYESFERYDNPRAFNQPTAGHGSDGEEQLEWRAYSSDEFRTQAEEAALGLLEIGLERGARVGLFLESDVYFCLADAACLISGMVDVPVYLTHQPEQVSYVLDHAETEALFVAAPEHLEKVGPLLDELERIETIILAQGDRSEADAELPERVDVLTFEMLRERGRERRKEAGDGENEIASLREKVDPGDLATLIYTSGTTGQPKGVMLTHDNIASNALTSLSCFTGYEAGAGAEVALSFLPLTHIYARTLDYYGYLSKGTSVYFCDPDDLSDALQAVRPTVFNTVPRLLEKVYGSIEEKTKSAEGIQKMIGTWALDLAKQYRIGEEPSLVYRVQQMVADALVYNKWREALGGRLKYATVGGAALNPDLANTFAAAGIRLVQGYGLTETSPVISFNRPDRNRAGTVGEPLPGVEVKIAEDGEILTRGPHVMQGYYKDDEETEQSFTEEGFFRTGDVGEMDGTHLKITDRKKALFKLSTGKYVVPSPLENRLATSNMVEQTVVVGSGHKYCAALIFPNEEAVRSFAEKQGVGGGQPFREIIQSQVVIDEFQRLVDEANAGMAPWSQIKRFTLVPEEISVENGLLTPSMKVKRSQVERTYDGEIDRLYEMAEAEEEKGGERVRVS